MPTESTCIGEQGSNSMSRICESQLDLQTARAKKIIVTINCNQLFSCKLDLLTTIQMLPLDQVTSYRHHIHQTIHTI